jgi:uncharacterized protein
MTPSETAETYLPSHVPTAPSQRLLLPDALRGFALLGILMVNMAGFQWPISQMLLGPRIEGVADTVTWTAVRVLFEGKFYVMFSLLFGLGFWQIMNRAAEKLPSVGIRVFLRRVGWMLLLGVTHITLLWPGDILLVYSLAGLLLLLFRNCGNRCLITWAVVLAMVPTVLTLGLAALMALANLTPEGRAEVEKVGLEAQQQTETMVARASETYQSGSFAEMVAMRWTEYSSMSGMIIVFLSVVLALFLVGIVAGRKGYFAKNAGDDRLTRKGLVFGAALGVPLSVAYVATYSHVDYSIVNLWTVSNLTLHTFGGVTLAWFYISVFRWILKRGLFRPVIESLAKVGRMSLSNYLLQSVICIFIFTNYGLARIGTLSQLEGVLLVILIFAIQVVLSRLWMARFRYGPMEWISRWVAYGKRPALRA